MGWVVGFEPTYTGATTLGLNHLTIPTMLVNCVHCVVAVSLALGYVHRYVPFGTHSTRLALRKISCACKFVNCVHYCVTASLALSCVHKTSTRLLTLAQRALYCARSF